MSAQATLSIKDVAARTGIEAPTLRMWEQRYGFPEPHRLPSGHRRYTDRDVARIAAVVSSRASGMSLSGAIATARSEQDIERPRGQSDSVYAELRRQRPDVQPYVLPKATLIGLSHAIEDEWSARGRRGTLIATFQEERFYRHAEERWRGFAATAEVAVVMADFDAPSAEPGVPVEIPIGREDPICREWTLVVESQGYVAMLSAWERPGQERTRDRQRVFETIWSIEPELVRNAGRVAAAIATRNHKPVGKRLDRALGKPLPTVDSGVMTALSNRMVAYATGDERITPLPRPHSSEAD